MIDIDEMAALVHQHRDEDHDKIRRVFGELRSPDVADVLNAVPSLAEAAEVLGLIPIDRAIAVCNESSLRRRSALIEQVPPDLAAKFLEGMASDERTAVMRRLTDHGCRLLTPLLSSEARKEVEQQLQFQPGTAGELMTTEFVCLSPEMTVADAIAKIRQEAQDRESIYACYVLEHVTSKLLGAVSLRDLAMAPPERLVRDVMRKNPVTVNVNEPRKSVVEKISKYNLLAVPVLTDSGAVIGFITVDDAIDVLIEEQTNTVLRMGAVEAGALDEPYMATPWMSLVKKRATWLVLLFLGEMLTASAMGVYEEEINQAVVLALFIPLIISSGGNSGSQATSLLIRALALGEVRLNQWFKVFSREIVSGLSLGLILGCVGAARICVWQGLSHYKWITELGLGHDYGEHWGLIALTISISLVGIVLWGSLAGSMLPFILKKFGLDPATSSAPLVATLVDVTGLVIYFSVAHMILRNTLLAG